MPPKHFCQQKYQVNLGSPSPSKEAEADNDDDQSVPCVFCHSVSGLLRMVSSVKRFRAEIGRQCRIRTVSPSFNATSCISENKSRNITKSHSFLDHVWGIFCFFLYPTIKTAWTDQHSGKKVTELSLMHLLGFSMNHPSTYSHCSRLFHASYFCYEPSQGHGGHSDV